MQPHSTPVACAGAVVAAHGFIQGKLTLSVAKLPNRLVNYTVEVSSDLRAWSSGPEAVETLEDSPEALRARAVLPVDGAAYAGFIRLRVEIAE